jgi:hypothetical protein
MRMMTENVLFKCRKSIYSWVGYFLDFCSTSGVTFHSSNNKKKNNNYCPAHATILKFFIARIQQRKSSPPSCFLPPYNQGCIWPSSCPDASSRSSAPARSVYILFYVSTNDSVDKRRRGTSRATSYDLQFSRLCPSLSPRAAGRPHPFLLFEKTVNKNQK